MECIPVCINASAWVWVWVLGGDLWALINDEREEKSNLNPLIEKATSVRK
jgi:hypothetical protein